MFGPMYSRTSVSQLRRTWLRPSFDILGLGAWDDAIVICILRASILGQCKVGRPRNLAVCVLYLNEVQGILGWCFGCPSSCAVQNMD